MKRSTQVTGFNYLHSERITKSWSQWLSDISQTETAGGYTRRIAGDLTAFSKKGEMLFEIYDQVTEEQYRATLAERVALREIGVPAAL